MRPTPYDPASPTGDRANRSAILLQGLAAGGALSGDARADVSMLVAILYPGSAPRQACAVVRQALQECGVLDGDVTDAEIIVAELAANCERHARPPYELRLFNLAGVPTWCEVVDSDPDLGWIPAVLDHSRPQTALDLFAENGRGLILVRELSQGHCRAYVTTTFIANTPAKAIAFALPTLAGTRLTCPPLLHLGRRSARLLLTDLSAAVEHDRDG
ncbi:ATP-binding protein [Streptosporangium sp. NPDC049078]|uniref:ATP-binding protein n=1 Tax=Streptosporangium sp. NPDC049078 TaxID=3155767 RepID=UPI003444BF94